MGTRKIVFISLLGFVLVGGVGKLYSYAYLPDDVSLNKALLIVSHNAPMAKAYGWIYYQQLGKMKDQWKAGSRGAKIPIMWAQQHFPIKKAPRIAICHEPNSRNNCNLTMVQRGGKRAQDAKSFFREFADLLSENPRDVAIIILEDYLDDTSKKSGTDTYTTEDVCKKLQDAFDESGLTKYALKLPSECYTRGASRPAKDWPTVGYMRATGKRLVIFTTSKLYAEGSPILNWARGIFDDTAWEIKVLDEIKNNKCTLRRKLPGANAFKVEHKDVSSVTKSSFNAGVIRFLNFLGIDMQGAIITDYNIVNSKQMIKKRVEQCKKACGVAPSILFLDMVEIGEGAEAVKDINRQRFGKLK